jgi:hypothetical protein
MTLPWESATVERSEEKRCPERSPQIGKVLRQLRSRPAESSRQGVLSVAP